MPRFVTEGRHFWDIGLGGAGGEGDDGEGMGSALVPLRWFDMSSESTCKLIPVDVVLRLCRCLHFCSRLSGNVYSL